MDTELYPRSVVYPLAVLCAVTTAAIAVALASVSVYQYTHHLP
jgi:hypothetical protein